jgi:DNA polymerase bacteriophage-type
MRECHIDLEWRSDVPIDRGAEQYFASPRSEPLLASYSFGGEIRRWRRGAPCPDDIRQHAESGGVFAAHNAARFEARAFDMVLTPRLGWPEVKMSQWRCTLARASALGLPKKLETLGAALGLKIQKSREGKDLIRFFCVPRKDGLFNEPEDHPEKFDRFHAYCDDDVGSEMEAARRMVPLSDAEQRIWELDAEINQRGLRIDRASCEAAIRLVARAEADLDRRMREITGGISFSQVAKLREWVQAQGVPLLGTAKDDVLEALDLEDLPDHVREALLIRQEAAKTSTRKLKAFLKRADPDDRIRGVFVYHGAAPGRWCLAKGSPVLVKTPSGAVINKPIEEVQRCDLVWDGDEWVEHEGVVFSGLKKVITHDGVTASPEHIVYLDDTSYISLGEAKRRGLKLYGKAPTDIHDIRSNVSGRKTIRGDDESID